MNGPLGRLTDTYVSVVSRAIKARHTLLHVAYTAVHTWPPDYKVGGCSSSISIRQTSRQLSLTAYHTPQAASLASREARIVFTARRYVKRGISRRRVSVCVCVCVCDFA